LGDGNPSIFISTLCPPHSKLRAFFVSGWRPVSMKYMG
jgi:hypothetical protein